MGKFFCKGLSGFVLSHSDYLSSGLGPQHTSLVHTHWQDPASASSAPVSTIQISNLALFSSFASSSILVVLCLYPVFTLYSSLPYSVPQEASPMECISPAPLSPSWGQPMGRPQQELSGQGTCWGHVCNLVCLQLPLRKLSKSWQGLVTLFLLLAPLALRATLLYCCWPESLNTQLSYCNTTYISVVVSSLKSLCLKLPSDSVSC